MTGQALAQPSDRWSADREWRVAHALFLRRSAGHRCPRR
jgi:hypothetical protein